MMRPDRSPRALALAILIGVALGLPPGCATPEPPPKGSPTGRPAASAAPATTGDPRQDYDAATVLAARDPAAGADALAAFTERWPASPLVLPAAIRAAELRARRDDLDGAAKVLSRSLERQPTAERSDAARLALARIERRRGDADAAAHVLRGLRGQRLTPPERRELLRLQADVAGDRGDRVEQIRRLADLRVVTQDADARAVLDADLDEAIARARPEELVRAAAVLGDRPPAARIRFAQVEQALGARDLDGALVGLADAARLPLSPEESERLVALEERVHALEAGGPSELPAYAAPPTAPLPETAGARGVLGVVLPLSGKLAAFGEQSLRGILVAAGFPDGTGDGEGVRLLVRDTGGSPTAAASAVHELALDPAVTAVIGPLTADEAEAAAPVADADALPLLALSARESLTQGRTHVFRLGVAPRAEAEALAEYAAYSLGLRRFAVLHPDDAFGRGLSELFQGAVLARGGTVTGVAAYSRKTVDFAKTLGQLVGGALPSAATPGAPFEAVFVADARERAVLIASQLTFHNLTGARLLGPRGWAHPEFLREGGRHVEGAILAEPFDPESGMPLVDEFVRRSRNGFDGEPDVLAAQAFDATLLAVAGLARGEVGRESMRAGLSRVRDVPGVAGATTVREDGNSSKRASLLAVEHGRFVRLGAR